jgi:hypothetical protein
MQETMLELRHARGLVCLANSEVRHLPGVTGLTANSYSSRVRKEASSGSR